MFGHLFILNANTNFQICFFLSIQVDERTFTVETVALALNMDETFDVKLGTPFINIPINHFFTVLPSSSRF